MPGGSYGFLSIRVNVSVCLLLNRADASDDDDDDVCDDDHADVRPNCAHSPPLPPPLAHSIFQCSLPSACVACFGHVVI